MGSVSKRRVPKLVAQKRNFVRGWHLDMRAQLGLAAQGSGRAPALGAAELYGELERIFHEQNLRVTSRSSERPACEHKGALWPRRPPWWRRRLLCARLRCSPTIGARTGRAPYLAASLAAYLAAFHPQELPPAVIDRISDQIARLSGTEPPALQQERREIVYSWHRNETLKRRQDGRQDEVGRDMLRPASQGSLPVSAGFDRTR